MSAADRLPTALFLLANDSVNIAWNLRRSKRFLAELLAISSV